MLSDTPKRRDGDLLAVRDFISRCQEDREGVSKSQLGTQHLYFNCPSPHAKPCRIAALVGEREEHQVVRRVDL